MISINPDEIVHKFAIYGEYLGCNSFGGGHINNTFQSRWNQAGTVVRYTHQKINHNVFLYPDKVMENIMRVTNHIADYNRIKGLPDWSRRSLTVVPAKDGNPWVHDEEDGWWRTYLYIEGTHTKDTASTPEEARSLGAGIGYFQKQLIDLPRPKLHETIPNFHKMQNRYLRFFRILEKDPCNRAKNIIQELNFLRKNEERGFILINALEERQIPQRICHNDTKMNNILLDDTDLSALCVIDLDTVMPGTILFDTGDLIRTVSSKAAEDETDLSKIEVDTNLYKSLMEGYLSESIEFLEPKEIALLAESGRNITQIMALRFLTDYLEGDKYFRISRPDHNLDRCRNQIALINSMDYKWEILMDIIKNCLYPYL